MGALSSLATLGLDLALSQKAQRQDDRQLSADRDQRIRQVQIDSILDEQKAGAALRRKLAEQRARAGAAGVASGGSADAVLSGLTEETRALQAARDAEDAARIDALRSTFGGRQRRNLLDVGSRWLESGSRELRSGQTTGRSLLD